MNLVIKSIAEHYSFVVDLRNYTKVREWFINNTDFPTEPTTNYSHKVYKNELVAFREYCGTHVLSFSLQEEEFDFFVKLYNCLVELTFKYTPDMEFFIEQE